VKFAIVSNGFADGPAQALRDYLVVRGADVVTVFHPLTPEQGTSHRIARYRDGALVEERTIRVPVGPPASFALDLFIPLLPPKVDVWFGFNPLACSRGLASRAECVVLWSVDFVPDRFGPGTTATRIYDRLDRLCCQRADARVELSEAARAGRNARHGLPADAPAHIVPMGAWVDRVPTTQVNGFERRRAVFLGHLVERQGVDTFLDALRLLDDIEGAVIGTGPLEQELRARAPRSVTFHGYVEDHREVERLLSEASVAAAPYAESFTRFADPGKLKAYLAAGLPIVLSDVPPNASELEQEAGAVIVAAEARPLADAIAGAHASPAEWQARRSAALGYAQRFDWNTLLDELFAKLSVSVS
jgi:glycosyltransferase involved in cell wall biosynthesis